MPQVILHEYNQITLPTTIIKQANIQPNDSLNVSYNDGVIRLTPKSEPIFDIMSLYGCANGVYGKTTEEMDDYVKNERKSWSE